ncbi:sequence-specific DNA-binding high mobility group box protein mat-Mc, partial [Dimargaris cristalligena]
DHIPRPKNAFIIYRSEKSRELMPEQDIKINQAEISKRIGETWNKEPKHVKDVYFRLAEEEKIAHAAKFPGYKYSSNKSAKK